MPRMLESRGMRPLFSTAFVIFCIVSVPHDGVPKMGALCFESSAGCRVATCAKAGHVAATFEDARLNPAAPGGGSTRLPQREPPIPKELLERMGEWAEYFLERSPSYAAEETLTQTLRATKGGERRVITSDYLFVRIMGGPRGRWEFRDVLAVDGKTILSAEKRSAKWPKIVAAQSGKEIAGLVEGPGKYLLTSEEFSGLALLAGRVATRNHAKMKYFFAQDTSDASHHVLIGYRQVAGEGLLVVDDKAVYAAGQAWVDADTGRVARIEEEFEQKQTKYWTAVEFALAEEIGEWLPREITVRVFEKTKFVQESVYSYSNFRALSGGAKTETGTKQDK